MEPAEKRRSIGKRWRPMLHLLFLAAIVILAVRFIDFAVVWRRLYEAEPLAVAGILALATLDRFLMAAKWVQLLRAVNVTTPFRFILNAYYQSAFVSYIPPTAVGGDVLRTYLVAKRSKQVDEVLATVIMEKILAVLSASLLGLLGLSLVLGSMQRSHGLYLSLVVLGGTVLGFAAFGASLYEPVYRRCFSLVERVLPARLHQFLLQLHKPYLVFRKHGSVLAWNLVLTVLEHVVQFGMMFLAGLALGITLEPLFFLAVIALVLFIRRLSIYLEGWGFAEAITVLLFTLVAVDQNMALSISLLVQGITLLAALPGAGLLLQSACGVKRSEREQMQRELERV